MATVTGWMADGALEWHGRPVARAVACASVRSRAVLTGVVRSVVTRHARTLHAPVGTVSRGTSLDVLLDDGTGTITVRWSGRDAIPGVRAGARLRVEGTVAELHGQLVIFNPLYRFCDAQDGSSVSW